MTVLLLGRHLELGHYRTEFLKSHGISTIFPESKEAAVAALQTRGFDAVVLSYSLSDKTAKEIIELKEQTCPDCPLIGISEQRWENRELNPDAVVLASDPPQFLVDAIRYAHNKRRDRVRRVKSLGRLSRETPDTVSW
jgi:DNA-binding NtrC family response regulator